MNTDVVDPDNWIFEERDPNIQGFAIIDMQGWNRCKRCGLRIMDDFVSDHDARENAIDTMIVRQAL